MSPSLALALHSPSPPPLLPDKHSDSCVAGAVPLGVSACFSGSRSRRCLWTGPLPLKPPEPPGQYLQARCEERTPDGNSSERSPAPPGALPCDPRLRRRLPRLAAGCLLPPAGTRADSGRVSTSRPRKSRRLEGSLDVPEPEGSSFVKKYRLRPDSFTAFLCQTASFRLRYIQTTPRRAAVNWEADPGYEASEPGPRACCCGAASACQGRRNTLGRMQCNLTGGPPSQDFQLESWAQPPGALSFQRAR
jgi:hypothetical protein